MIEASYNGVFSFKKRKNFVYCQEASIFILKTISRDKNV